MLTSPTPVTSPKPHANPIPHIRTVTLATPDYCKLSITTNASRPSNPATQSHPSHPKNVDGRYQASLLRVRKAGGPQEGLQVRYAGGCGAQEGRFSLRAIGQLWGSCERMDELWETGEWQKQLWGLREKRESAWKLWEITERRLLSKTFESKRREFTKYSFDEAVSAATATTVVHCSHL